MTTLGTAGAACLVLVAMLAAAGCKTAEEQAARDAEVAATRAQIAADLAAQQNPPTPAAPAPDAVAQNGDNLVSFDLVKGQAGQLVGTFTKTGGGSWTGPYPTTGQTITWSGRSDALSVALYTENPQITTIVLYIETMDISSSAMDPAENFRISSAVFQ